MDNDKKGVGKGSRLVRQGPVKAKAVTTAKGIESHQPFLQHHWVIVHNLQPLQTAQPLCFLCDLPQPGRTGNSVDNDERSKPSSNHNRASQHLRPVLAPAHHSCCCHSQAFPPSPALSFPANILFGCSTIPLSFASISLSFARFVDE